MGNGELTFNLLGGSPQDVYITYFIYLFHPCAPLFPSGGNPGVSDVYLCEYPRDRRSADWHRLPAPCHWPGDTVGPWLRLPLLVPAGVCPLLHRPLLDYRTQKRHLHALHRDAQKLLQPLGVRGAVRQLDEPPLGLGQLVTGSCRHAQSVRGGQHATINASCIGFLHATQGRRACGLSVPCVVHYVTTDLPCWPVFFLPRWPSWF